MSESVAVIYNGCHAFPGKYTLKGSNVIARKDIPVSVCKADLEKAIEKLGEKAWTIVDSAKVVDSTSEPVISFKDESEDKTNESKENNEPETTEATEPSRRGRKKKTFRD